MVNSVLVGRAFHLPGYKPNPEKSKSSKLLFPCGALDKKFNFDPKSLFLLGPRAADLSRLPACTCLLFFVRYKMLTDKFP